MCFSFFFSFANVTDEKDTKGEDFKNQVPEIHCSHSFLPFYGPFNDGCDVCR